MPRLEDTAIIILAAGQGTRMGQPKALMEVGGQPWWRRQAQALEALALRQIWVVSPAVEAALAAEDDAPLERQISDPASPPFASLLIGLRSLSGQQPSGVFVLPIDVPCPTRAVLQALSGPSADPTVPANDDERGHPPYLPWPWAQDHLLDAGDDAPQRLDHLLRQHAIEVEVNDPRVTMNLNVPEDVQDYLDLIEGEGS
jgi:CTP:molybdopterin cytidylyltransferase MocA